MLRSIHKGRMVPVTSTLAEPIPKPHTFRSPTMRAVAQHLPCSWPVPHACRGDCVWCHENEGKGTGIKSSDACGAVMCQSAHKQYDEGSDLDRCQKREYFAIASRRTLIRMVEGGWLVPTLKPKVAA